MLADFTYAAIWMVPTYHLISKSSSPFAKPLSIVPSELITIGITVSSSCSIVFIVLWQSLVTYRFFHFLYVKVHFSAGSLFIVDYVWSSGRNEVICLYLRIPVNFVHLILPDGFWVVHILFVPVVKFQLIAQFPVSYLLHAVVFSLILLLCKFAAFTFYVILLLLLLLYIVS